MKSGRDRHQGTAARVTLLAHRISLDQPTGIYRYVREMTLALQAARPEEVTYAVASPRGDRTPAWLPNGVEHHTIRGPRQLTALSWCLAGRPRIDRSARGTQLFHALYPWVSTPTRAPLVATVHDLLISMHPEWYPRKERFGFERAIRHFADHAAHVIAISQYVADQLPDRGIEAERITVAHNGIARQFSCGPIDPAAVDAALSRYGLEPGGYFVAVGLVSRHKNLPVVLEALARTPPLPGGGPDLVVAGPDSQGASEIRDLAASLALGTRVRFAGFVPDDDLTVLVANAIALVHPSRHEGFGLTPLEAMAAGTPAIVSEVGATREVLGDDALLLAPDDPDQWAGSMQHLASDEMARAELAKRGEARSARYTWENAAAVVQSVHRSVLGA